MTQDVERFKGSEAVVARLRDEEQKLVRVGGGRGVDAALHALVGPELIVVGAGARAGRIAGCLGRRRRAARDQPAGDDARIIQTPARSGAEGDP